MGLRNANLIKECALARRQGDMDLHAVLTACVEDTQARCPHKNVSAIHVTTRIAQANQGRDDLRRGDEYTWCRDCSKPLTHTRNGVEVKKETGHNAE